jgi:hypothetical protein
MLLIKKSSQQSIFHSEREPDGPEKSQRGKIFIRILLFYQFTAPFVNCGGPMLPAGLFRGSAPAPRGIENFMRKDILGKERFYDFKGASIWLKNARSAAATI